MIPVRPKMGVSGGARDVCFINAIEYERVEVDVQVECVAEALDERDGTAPSRLDPPLAFRSSPVRSEHCAREDVEGSDRELGVVSHPATQRNRHQATPKKVRMGTPDSR